MRNNKKNTGLLVAVIAIIGLLWSKKAAASPSVEVGEGDFLDFNTDGDFPDDTYSLKSVIPSSVVPSVMTSDFNDSEIVPILKTNSSYGCGCGNH